MTQPSLAGTRLDPAAYAAHLDADVAALLAAATDLSADVPGCPGWTVRDLLSHVLGVFRHKSAAMDAGASPSLESGDWGDLAEGEDPRPLLEAAYADLRTRLDVDPATPTWTWWPAEQTVGFWQRRMAQETAVHRWDAESAVHGPDGAGAVPDDLALDGIDELVGWLAWPWDDVPQPAAAGQRVLVSTADAGWIVTLHPTRVEVAAAGESPDADALLAGDPSGLLLHLWGRPGEHGIAAVGDADALELAHARFRMLGT